MGGGVKSVMWYTRSLNTGERIHGCLCQCSDQSNHRYIINLTVADYSGQAWFQGFNEIGTTLIGKSADELHEIRVGTSDCCIHSSVSLRSLTRNVIKMSSVLSSRRRVATFSTWPVAQNLSLST